MLTMTEISNNRERFLGLIDELCEDLQLEAGSLDRLKDFLNNSDFFFAPASTQYAYSYDGGLCEHSLNTYDLIKKFNQTMCVDFTKAGYSDASLKIVALFHDLYKINYYQETVKNKKVYSEDGKKSDELGRFDWVSEKAYTIKDIADRDTLGSNGLNSYFILSQYISLLPYEATAIINHTSGMDTFTNDKSVTDVLAKYPIVCLLHMADYMSTFYMPNRATLDVEQSLEDNQDNTQDND